MRVGDLVEQLITSPLPDPTEADPVAARESFVPTLESLEVISRVLEAASSPAERSCGAALLVLGKRGVGKTHLLRYLLALLGNPDDPAWNELEKRVTRICRPRRPLRGMLVDVSEDTREPLNVLLRRRFGWEIDTLAESPDSIPDILAFDGLSSRAVNAGDDARVEEDLAYCARLASAFAQVGRCLLFAAEERHVRPQRNTPTAPPLGSLAEKCSVVWLSTKSVAELVASGLSRKREGSRSEIARLHQRLLGYLPRIESDEETFFNLYPVLPAVFEGLFSIRELLPRFSPAGFVQWAVDRAMDRPAEAMVTLSDLYESVMPLLRDSERGEQLLHAAEEMEAATAGHLRRESHARSKDVVRAVVCMTAMEAESIDPVHLANGLLLYDSSGALPGYGLAEELLEQLEEECPSIIGGDGNGESRSYRIRPSRPAGTSAAAPARSAARWAECEENPTAARVEPGPPTDEAHRGLPWTKLVSETLIPEPGEFLERLRALPSAVRTTKVWETIRPVHSRLEALVQLRQQAAGEGVDPREAEAYYSQLFSGNRRLFDEWNLLRTEIITWLEWLPSFERIHQYIGESFPTGLSSVDAARDQLLASLGSPHVLMNEGPRAKLEEDFSRFRVQYTGYYEALHESTVGSGAARGKETTVDVAGLRNLDLLSRLPYVDKKWFHRTRMKVQRLQRRRCSLPVRKVLEGRSRCFCNFNPSGDRTLVETVADLNELIRDGTESLRAFLRRGAAVIIHETGSSPHEDAAVQPIAALLSSGAMLPLTQEAIETLRGIMLRHPAAFHAGR